MGKQNNGKGGARRDMNHDLKKAEAAKAARQVVDGRSAQQKAEQDAMARARQKRADDLKAATRWLKGALALASEGKTPPASEIATNLQMYRDNGGAVPGEFGGIWLLGSAMLRKAENLEALRAKGVAIQQQLANKEMEVRMKADLQRKMALEAERSERAKAEAEKTAKEEARLEAEIKEALPIMRLALLDGCPEAPEVEHIVPVATPPRPRRMNPTLDREIAAALRRYKKAQELVQS